MDFASSAFWIGLIQIIGIDIVLSGDNAVVIALAARALPPRQQRQAVVCGTLGAIVMRVSLAVLALELLRLPWLRLIGAALLLWIGVKLLLPEAEADGAGTEHSGLFAAIRTIMIADLVMSLDNVVAVAAAARESVGLLVFGLALSIPLVIFGSTILLRLMERYPVIITLGAAILGFVAGEMAISDHAIAETATRALGGWTHAIPLAAALGVVAAGRGLARRATAGLPVRELPLPDAAPSAIPPPGDSR